MTDRPLIDKIRALVGCDVATANKIEDRMEIDFSECTIRQFNAEVRFAAKALGIKIKSNR